MAYVSVLVVEQAIRSLTHNLKRPPVSGDASETLNKNSNTLERTVFYHNDILRFRGAMKGVTPDHIRALAMVETDQLVYYAVILCERDRVSMHIPVTIVTRSRYSELALMKRDNSL
jgi:hypothetical protein